MSAIRHATVLGAGTMGAQIAAHLANAGVPVLLLDRSAAEAAQGLGRARGLKPDPFFLPDSAALIRTAGFDQLAEATSSDWIIEAIVEELAAKQALVAQVDRHRAEHAVVTSNTSGISLGAIAEGRSAGFRRNWLGTHFFNPPRYLHLVEVIPTPDTDPVVTERLSNFIDVRLGKGVVVAKDTPAFIANRIGLFGVVRLLEALASGEYSVEEIDAITGPAIGRPKSATFRTMDLAGIDVLALVTRDLAKRLPEDEGRAFVLPPLVDDLVARGWLGEKRGQGFYKRVRDAGETRILALDVPALLAGSSDPYRESRPPELPSLDSAARLPDIGERLRTLFNGGDKVATLLQRAVRPTLEYAARVAPLIAHSPDDVDRAMRWGFGWQLGPIETLEILFDGVSAFRRTVPGPAEAGRHVRRADLQVRREIVRDSAAADLLDLGDGVFGIELHSKMNTIGEQTIEMLLAGVAHAEEKGAALVVAGRGDLFSAGADLKALVAAADTGRWNDIDAMIRRFQRATMRIKTATVPVVAATRGLALGGGCEICLHAARRQAAAETYMGLVETGVGLIPAAGGTKEMVVRSGGDAQALQRAFETIALAKVSTSAPDARRLGYLCDTDGLTMNHDRLIADAKAVALTLGRTGYQPARTRTDVVAGGPDMFARLALGIHLAQRAGRASEHDALVARKLARVMAGGDLPHRATVSEERLLDLEREAFLSLCGEPKTLDRIRHTLKTGKPLRN